MFSGLDLAFDLHRAVQELRSSLKPVDTFYSALDKLHCSFQLTWAAVQVGSGGADAAVTSKRFQDVDGSAFVGQVC